MLKTRLLLSSFLLGMHAISAASPALITKEYTDFFVREHEYVDSSQREKWSSYVDSLFELKPPPVVEWVQPVNKKVPCKVFFGGDGKWRTPEFKVYWDGDCQNGRAFGIGREFVVTNGELASSLADYSSELKAPRYFLDVEHDRQRVAFQSKLGNIKATRTYALHTNSEGQNVRVETTVIDNVKNRLYQDGTWLSADQRELQIILPNERGYRFSFKDDGVSTYRNAAPFDGKTNVAFGLGVQDRAGTKFTRHVRILGPNKYEDVVLPENWKSHFTALEIELETALNRGDQLLEEAYIAVSKYKRKICRGDVKVDFVDAVTYGRVCLPEGDLSIFNSVAEKQKVLKHERHAKAQANYKLQMGEAAQQLQQRQEQNAQIERQRAAANQRHGNGDDFANSLKSFANGMEAMRRDATDFTRSFQNANPAPAVQFHAPESKVTNCIVVGNFVQCR